MTNIFSFKTWIWSFFCISNEFAFVFIIPLLPHTIQSQMHTLHKVLSDRHMCFKHADTHYILGRKYILSYDSNKYYKLWTATNWISSSFSSIIFTVINVKIFNIKLKLILNLFWYRYTDTHFHNFHSKLILCIWFEIIYHII